MQRLCATVHVHKTEVAWPQHGQGGWAGFGSLEWRLGQCSPLDQRHFIQHPSTRRASLPVTPPLLFLLLPVVTHCRSNPSVLLPEPWGKLITGTTPSAQEWSWATRMDLSLGLSALFHRIL